MGMDVTTSSCLCRKLVPFVISNCCKILKVEDPTGAPHETMVVSPVLKFFACPEQFRSMKGVENQKFRTLTCRQRDASIMMPVME